MQENNYRLNGLFKIKFVRCKYLLLMFKLTSISFVPLLHSFQRMKILIMIAFVLAARLMDAIGSSVSSSN